MLFLILTLCLCLIAGVSKGLADRLQFHIRSFGSPMPKHWFYDPKVSWKNKYKNRDPQQGPKFPGSTTIFVFVTDAWHLCQFFLVNSLVLAMLFYHYSSTMVTPVVDILIFRLVFGIGFKLVYR